MAVSKRNFMDELKELIFEIESLKPEPEVCNIRCPPLGCPVGPCPGMCCYEGICDPCCVSKMPKCPPPPHPPQCCAPPNMLSSKSCGQKIIRLQTCMPNPCNQNFSSPCCTTASCSQSQPESTCGQGRTCPRPRGPPSCCLSTQKNQNLPCDS